MGAVTGVFWVTHLHAMEKQSCKDLVNSRFCEEDNKITHLLLKISKASKMFTILLRLFHIPDNMIKTES